MCNFVETHDEVILAERDPVRADDQRVYLCFNCKLDRVARLNFDYFVDFNCDDGWFLFGNLMDLLVNFCFKIPPDNHAVFSTSHQPVFPVLESRLYLWSYRRLSILNFTGNSTSSFAYKRAVIGTDWFKILRLYLCFFQILQEEVVVVVVKLNLAHESSMAHASVQWFEIFKDAVYDESVVIIPHCHHFALLFQRGQVPNSSHTDANRVPRNSFDNFNHWHRHRAEHLQIPIIASRHNPVLLSIFANSKCHNVVYLSNIKSEN